MDNNEFNIFSPTGFNIDMPHDGEYAEVTADILYPDIMDHLARLCGCTFTNDGAVSHECNAKLWLRGAIPSKFIVQDYFYTKTSDSSERVN